jgi:hypothetical protein
VLLENVSELWKQPEQVSGTLGTSGSYPGVQPNGPTNQMMKTLDLETKKTFLDVVTLLYIHYH